MVLGGKAMRLSGAMVGLVVAAKRTQKVFIMYSGKEIAVTANKLVSKKLFDFLKLSKLNTFFYKIQRKSIFCNTTYIIVIMFKIHHSH